MEMQHHWTLQLQVEPGGLVNIAQLNDVPGTCDVCNMDVACWPTVIPGLSFMARFRAPYVAGTCPEVCTIHHAQHF